MTRLGAALLATGVSALLVLPPLGQRTLATNDEVRFALLARDMLNRGAFYLGRPVLRMQTVQEFDTYLRRADRPVDVVNNRTWLSIQGQTLPGIRVLEETTIGGQRVLIVRRDGP